MNRLRRAADLRLGRILIGLAVLSGSSLLLGSCAKPQAWPESPLFSDVPTTPGDDYPRTREEAIEAIVGRYAHYDVVAYEDQTTKTPMRTFIISYGFTEFEDVGGKLFQKDSFGSATYKLNQKAVRTSLETAAVRAIQPRVQEVELFWEDGLWQVYRPESPTLLGITGDPNQPLSRDANDPAIIDTEGDGKPGVTVSITIGGLIKGELYITRREIYRNHLTLFPDGRLIGSVEDHSEQFVIDATMAILRQPSNNVQAGGPGLNPIYLVPVSDDIADFDTLMDHRDELFPPEPEFRTP